MGLQWALLVIVSSWYICFGSGISDLFPVQHSLITPIILKFSPSAREYFADHGYLSLKEIYLGSEEVKVSSKHLTNK